MTAGLAKAAALRRGLSGSLVSLGVGLAVLLTGCGGSPSDADAPYTVAGLNSTSGPDGPGMALTVGVPVAIRTGSVVLESAALVQLPGYPLPHMVAVGLVPGKGYDVVTWGWPPHGFPGETDVGPFPVRPLAGYVLTAGHPIAIYYAFSGDRPGQTYYAAGIELRYRRGTQEHTVTIYQVGADCVTAGFPKVAPECRISSAANDRIEALPH